MGAKCSVFCNDLPNWEIKPGDMTTYRTIKKPLDPSKEIFKRIYGQSLPTTFTCDSYDLVSQELHPYSLV